VSLLVVILAVSWTAVSCAKKSEASEDAKTTTATVVPVVRVARHDLSTDITLTGEFIPYQEVDVMAKVAGYIRSIKVDIGDRVREGQVLAQLEVPEMQDDLTRAAASVEAAEAEAVTARDDLNRAKSAHEMAHLSFTRVKDVATREPGLVPLQEVDEAHSKDLVAEAEVAAAQSKLQAAQRKSAMTKAEQSRWGTLQKYTIITAPFAGVVTKRYANTGSMIQAGTASQTQAMPVVRLSETSLLRLILPVPESAVPSLQVGDAVNVSVPSLRKTFPGRVTRFAGEVKMSTRTMDAEVDVPNKGFVLVPGMYAEVKLRLEQSKNAIVVPLGTVDEAGGAPHIYTVQGSTVRIVPVVLGIKTAQLEEIRSGVQEGDLVVTGRRTGLQNGDTVEPKVIERGAAPIAKTQGS
jgi:RND family efflux transporter MFP subunit